MKVKHLPVCCGSLGAEPVLLFRSDTAAVTGEKTKVVLKAVQNAPQC